MKNLSSLSKRSMMPSLASELFDSENFFSPRIWDFGGNFFDLKFDTSIPSLNIIENKNDFKIELAAPGLEKKDFKVKVERGLLTISAEQETKKDEEKENYTRKEFSYSSFSRSVRLPEHCDYEKISAKYEKGVLNLTIPKRDSKLKDDVKVIEVV